VVSYYASLPAVPASAAKGVTPFLPYEHGKEKSAACAECHNADGNSTTPGVPSLAGQQPRYFVVALQEYLHGARKTDPMHALLPLLDKLDMESLALYFASQTPAQRSAPPSGDPVAGESLSMVCGGCHGPRGLSTDAATATLAGQDPTYLVDAIKSYKKVRQHNGMRALVSKLSDKDIQDIAAFYAVQKSKPAENGKVLVKELIEKCDRCHKSGLENPSMAVPTINGQDKDYLIMSLRSYRDTRRENSLMHNMSLPYSDAVIEGIATYYASQPAK
jgi:cytochrome c553